MWPLHLHREAPNKSVGFLLKLCSQLGTHNPNHTLHMKIQPSQLPDARLHPGHALDCSPLWMKGIPTSACINPTISSVVKPLSAEIMSPGTDESRTVHIPDNLQIQKILNLLWHKQERSILTVALHTKNTMFQKFSSKLTLCYKSNVELESTGCLVMTSHVCMSSSSVNWLTSFSWTVTVGGALKKWKMGQGGQKRFLLCAYHQQLTDFEGFYTTYLHENDEDKRTSMEDCSKVILVLLVTATDALRLCVVTCKQANINRSLQLGFYSRKLSPPV